MAGPAENAGSAMVAVAYSAGADSTALLLAAIEQWPGSVMALHVHHGLQEAADDFEAHAHAVCRQHQIPFFVSHVQAAHDPGESPEAAARGKRYQALAMMAREAGATWVLLGQHADDQAETLLLALSRGAGLPGLASMPEAFVRHGVHFGRPLLEVGPQAMREWLERQGQGFVDDPSNADTRLTRNRIRAGLLPALKTGFPAYQQTLARSARHAAQAQELLDELASLDLAQTGCPPNLAPLQALGRSRQANLLRCWLRREAGTGASTAQLDELLDQVAACTTRGHHIHIRVASGFVQRDGARLVYSASI